MRVPRSIAIAALTAVTVGSVSHAMLPSTQDRTDPAKAQTELTREYNQHRKRELEELRAKSAREADALAADKLRPAERRAAEKEAGAIVKGLLKRP